MSLISPGRPPSRPSSVNSFRSTTPIGRSHSPSLSTDDPVLIRNQMSTLRHSIRHQQAQLQHLESALQLAPRRPITPMQPSPPSSPLPPAANGTGASPPSPSPLTLKASRRRSSFETLASLAGPESSLPLPLPKREREQGMGSSIREGIPMEFGGAGPSREGYGYAYKRQSSPTRTLSRIPVSSVGNARALAEEVNTPPRYPHSHSNSNSNSNSTSLSLSSSNSNSTSLSLSSSNSNSTSLSLSSSASADNLPPPSSPSANSSGIPSPTTVKRMSLTPGGTTKVLADLQTGVINARNALENTKAQLRLSQRSVAQLTRQTEDLKDVRERLRLENEGLNNVVARKERLLQEVLERARKAEAEAATLKTQVKTEGASTKKSLKEMEAALAESSALSSKSEREYVTLRDAVRALKEGWAADVGALKEEMRAGEERWRAEVEALRGMKDALRKEAEGRRAAVEKAEGLRGEASRVEKAVEDAFRAEIEGLRTMLERSEKEHAKAGRTAEHLAGELARLRRLMQSAPPPDDAPS
ncbi:hypothetical protein OF83DRAFT_94029 [Amylostereum chailletii]|nr:hypothetical protein OF83DRAFT_94029 [Amylostereum chailletii]